MQTDGSDEMGYASELYGTGRCNFSGFEPHAMIGRQVCLNPHHSRSQEKRTAAKTTKANSASEEREYLPARIYDGATMFKMWNSSYRRWRYSSGKE
jgi:hypothetical protein